MSPARPRQVRSPLAKVALLPLVAAALAVPAAATAAPPSPAQLPVLKPHVSEAVAHDVSPSLSALSQRSADRARRGAPPRVVIPEGGRDGAGHGQASQRSSSGDAARQATTEISGAPVVFPIANFEGLSSQDNFDAFGFRVNPPDPVGDVGPRHYVEMTNLTVGVFSKTGTPLTGPVPIGDLWAGFAVDDCTDPSGDPIVLYDQLANRWILTQFTTRGLDDPSLPFYNCIAISRTGDPTGSYYRYAFTTGFNFPDYPKYGVWTNAYVLTTREFGPTTEYGIGVYGLEKAKMLKGQPARSVTFFVDGNDPTLLPLVGDGLLPADIDGKRKPPAGSAIPLVGTQDDDASYGATFDAANVWDFRVRWGKRPSGSLVLADQLPVAPFDTDFPCAPTSRDCLPQPGITDPTQYLDTLASRQRPTWRLAYRNFGGYESLVTNQTVEAAPSVAGVRWYEIRRNPVAQYALYQQGTYAPADGINRWMGSIAQDRRGNLGLGYSVVNGTDVYPGIRFTGRFAGDAPGTMTLREGIIANGTGVQTTTNSRWGDYTSMNVDPVDDCTFWYVNEYYTEAGQASSPVGWQTRIASFKMPGC